MNNDVSRSLLKIPLDWLDDCVRERVRSIVFMAIVQHVKLTIVQEIREILYKWDAFHMVKF